MKIKRNAKIWAALAESCDTPGYFIKCVMALRNENAVSLSKKLNTTPAYVAMVAGDKCAVGFKACIRIANVLDIDPYLLARIWTDYSIRKLINKEK